MLPPGPAPPASAALTISTSGYDFLKAAYSASSASTSPGRSTRRKFELAGRGRHERRERQVPADRQQAGRAE